MRVCTLLLVSAFASRACAAPLDGPVDLCNFRPVLKEDFSQFNVASRALGQGHWTAHTPWNGDFGDAQFVDPGPNGPFLPKEDGLSIVAKRDAGGRWTSGLLAAADASGAGYGVLNGYFSARMKFPPGPGIWPSFWLTTLKPVSDKSPSVEIDAVEYYGLNDAAFMSALHVWYAGEDAAKSRQALHKTTVAPGALTSGFHDYGVRVASDQIVFYFDGRQIWRQPTPAELTKPLYPLVDLALGSGFPIDKTPNPSVLSVASVQVFAFDPDNRNLRCPPGTH